MKNFFVRFLITIVIAVFALWFGGKFYFSFSLPQYSGQIQLPNISSNIEITFDQKGIPQIWAETDNDMYFALGWLHASDRLFQMELVRRYSQGRLSELFGEIAFELDVRQRRIGFERKAYKDRSGLSDKSEIILQSYINGINEWKNQIAVLPPEFIALQITPRDWVVEDCLSILYYQSWFAHELMDRDQLYNKVSEILGDEMIALFDNHLQWSPPTIHNSFVDKFFSGVLPTQMSVASNSWVASPFKSESGSAIHASDPHLAINSFPGFWYIAGLHSEEGTNSIGITAAGLPFVGMGHNDSVAYAFTVASIDLIDYFIEKKNPDDSLSVLTPSGYSPISVLEDEILVKDEEKPRNIKILLSDNGPVVQSDSLTYTTLKWAGYDFNVGEIFNNAIQLNTVKNFDHFRSIVTSLGALDVNWTYSDKHGNIGYQLGAPIPIRKNTNSFVYLKGEDPNNNWLGYLPLEQTPHLFNPEEGWLATCNNQIVSEQWPYYLPGYYDPYRIIRAEQLLKSKDIFSVKDFEEFQLDGISGSFIQWKNLFAASAKHINNIELFHQIEKWDGHLNRESKIASLYQLWEHYLPESLFADELGEDWTAAKYIMRMFLTNPIDSITDNKSTPQTESLIDIAGQTLLKAIEISDNRTYGEISKISVKHPLSVVKALDIYFNLNRGPYYANGSGATLNSNFNRFNEETKTFETEAGPSMRFVLDWANVDSFSININTGQSGNPLSNHYDDFLNFMRDGKRWNVPFSKNEVYSKSKNLLTLTPNKE